MDRSGILTPSLDLGNKRVWEGAKLPAPRTTVPPSFSTQITRGMLFPSLLLIVKWVTTVLIPESAKPGHLH